MKAPVGRFRRLLGPLVAGLVVACVRPAAGAAPARAESPPPARYVLQIGIERYRWVPRLEGPLADVRDLRDVLIRRYGFQPGDFRTLVDSQATHDGILAAIREQLVDNARRHPGALCVLQFSGHGSRVADLDHESWEPDGYDETLVPWDGRDPDGRVSDVLDDDLAVLFAELRRSTNRVVLIFDSCNAGTITRGLATGRTLNGLPAPPARTRPATPMVNEDSIGVGLFAAPPGQRSWIEDIGGQSRSVFSYQLARTLERASSRTTYAQVLQQVNDAIRARYGDQSPFGEGPLEQPVFAGAARDDDADLAVHVEGRGRLRVDAGLLQGITLGSTFAVRAPRGAPVDSVLVEGLVTQVGPSDCRVRVTESVTVPEGARAILRGVGVGYEPVRFVWAAGDSVAAFARARLRARLQGDPLVELADAPVGGGGAPVLGVIAWRPSSPADACDEGPALPAGLAILLDGGTVALGRVFRGDREADVDSLETALRRVALAENVRRLGSGGSPLADGVDFALVVERRGAGAEPAVDTLRAGSAGAALQPGDRVRVRITNRGDRRVSVAVLHVSPGRTCDVASPAGGVGVFVAPGATFLDDAWLEVEAPCGLDHLKLVVTDHPVDLAAVSEPVRTRGGLAASPGIGGSLGRVLWTAGRTGSARGAAEPVEWAVRDLTLFVAPR